MPVRSAYLRQVERIAPPELLGRDAELGELAAFCTEDHRSAYVWWRAGPWAGKSALLSTFVLSPPSRVHAAGVRLVSFFITARLASQDTRDAFTTAVTEQLCALLGEDLPAATGEGGREAAMLDLLAQAAGACRASGGRLVLVIDGLDEDRGVTTGPDAHSIAALLPGRPPAGMRIIATGRPNPPVPDDVPDWHPLRDPGAIRLLSDSPHARDLQRLGQTELKRLLSSSPVERDLLGLLTAARGGLTGPDLRELTGTELWTVEETLHTVTGRTFTTRPTRWGRGREPQLYLLGHEELQTAAAHYLGHENLARYRDRIHTWADAYRTPTGPRPSWPPHTPEYLFTGYPRMLAATHDADRLLDLALDSARHDRMLDLSGGDSAALAEVTTCQDLLLARPEVDLYALAVLSRRRAQLEDRNAHIPTCLPAVWAALGQPDRARALAMAIPDPDRRAEALTGLARTLTGAPHPQRALAVAHAAEQATRTIPHMFSRVRALQGIATALAGTAPDWAEQVARSITDPRDRAQALAAVVTVLADVDPDRAERVARSITDPRDRAQALAALVTALAGADPERALALAHTAEQATHGITAPGERAWAVVEVVAAIVGADPERALALSRTAERIARSMTEPYWQARALADVVTAIAGVDPDRAERVARSITEPRWQAQALAAVVAALADSDPERALALAYTAEQVAHSIFNSEQELQALTSVAKALAVTDPEGAERVVRSSTNPLPDPQALALALSDVATAIAGADVDRAERIARSISRSDWQVLALRRVAAAVAGTAPDRARHLARSAARIVRRKGLDLVRELAELADVIVGIDPGHAHELVVEAENLARTTRQRRGLAGTAMAVVVAATRALTADDPERALAMGRTAEQVARSISASDGHTPPSGHQSEALAEVAAVIAGIDPDGAERIAHSIHHQGTQVRALAAVVAALAGTDPGRALSLARTAERVARSITDPQEQVYALAEVAAALAGTDPGRALALAGTAEEVARSITDPQEQVYALAEVAA
ncbi:hypothetical protein, partial [Kitasatospora nipponensis]